MYAKDASLIVTPKQEGNIEFNHIVLVFVSVRRVCKLGGVYYGLEGVHCSLFFIPTACHVTMRT